MNIIRNDDQIEISQKFVIDQILNDMYMKNESFKCSRTPMHSSNILQIQENEQEHDNRQFHYESIITN